MTTKTLAEFRTYAAQDLDIQNDSDIIPTELLDEYIQDSIDYVEQILLNLDEDYLLTSESLDLVSGTKGYALPADVYANKLRGVLYNNGSDIYAITRLKRAGTFENGALIDQGSAGSQRFQYRLKNVDATEGFTMELYPTPGASESDTVEYWYLRNLARPVAEADVIDAPEAYPLMKAHVRVSCLTKIHGGITPPTAVEMLEKAEARYVETMKPRVMDDSQGEMEADTSHYKEHN